jgi:ADP-heptose:LPS heptosyltransferase
MSSKRVLVLIKPRFLGDAVIATPVLKRLQAEYGGGGVTVWPHVADMLREDLPGFRFLEVTASRSFPSLLREARRLRAKSFDSALIINRSFRAALLAYPKVSPLIRSDLRANPTAILPEPSASRATIQGSL